METCKHRMGDSNKHTVGVLRWPQSPWGKVLRSDSGKDWHGVRSRVSEATLTNCRKLGSLKQQKFILLTVLEARIPKSKFWQGYACSRGCREECVCLNSSCSNKIPQTGQKLESPRSMCWEIWFLVRTHFLAVHSCLLSGCSHGLSSKHEREGALVYFFLRANLEGTTLMISS